MTSHCAYQDPEFRMNWWVEMIALIFAHIEPTVQLNSAHWSKEVVLDLTLMASQ